MAKRKAELEAAGIDEVVVFHSSRAEMIKYQGQLPFNCIADPGKKLYRKFGVETSLLALLNPGVLINGARWVIGQRRFYRKTENGIFGLPADFLIDASGTVKAVHYGKHADDHWSVDLLLELAGAIGA
jgi:peroxiredoxin